MSGNRSYTEYVTGRAFLEEDDVAGFSSWPLSGSETFPVEPRQAAPPPPSPLRGLCGPHTSHRARGAKSARLPGRPREAPCRGPRQLSLIPSPLHFSAHKIPFRLRCQIGALVNRPEGLTYLVPRQDAVQSAE